MPYIHIMVYHVPTFIEKYKRIKQFSCQGTAIHTCKGNIYSLYVYHLTGIEKTNDMAKKVFF